jgi:hypothetical protein
MVYFSENNSTTSMLKLFFFFVCLLPFTAQAQLFFDASANLPNNGAKGQSMDVRAADIDGDGDLDIVLANEFQANTILLNDGKGLFTNGTAGKLPQEVHDSEDVVIARLNDDAHLDLVFCSEDDVTLGWTNVHEFYLGDGQGGFTAATYQFPDSEANAVIVGYVNNDTLPDLLFGNDGGTGILINQGNGSFAVENNRVPQLSRTTQDLALADVDGDGDLDLFEGNENGNVLHVNYPDSLTGGQFSDETASRLPQGLNIETRKVTFGDVDGDNDLDIFLSNVAFIAGKNPQNRLLINDGKGYFSDETSTRLPLDSDHTIDAIFEDVDLDGDLDLVVANVFGAPLKIYQNDSTGVFTDATQVVLGQSYVRDALGVIAEDFNGDGLRDLYICDRKTPQTNNKDLLLLRQSVTAAPEPTNNAPFVLVYPNPVRDFFFVKTNLEQLDSLHLTDSAGRVLQYLHPKQTGAGTFRVAIGKLPAGIYFVDIAGVKKRVLVLW